MAAASGCWLRPGFAWGRSSDCPGPGAVVVPGLEGRQLSVPSENSGRGGSSRPPCSCSSCRRAWCSSRAFPCLLRERPASACCRSVKKSLPVVKGALGSENDSSSLSSLLEQCFSSCFSSGAGSTQLWRGWASSCRRWGSAPSTSSLQAANEQQTFPHPTAACWEKHHSPPCPTWAEADSDFLGLGEVLNTTLELTGFGGSLSPPLCSPMGVP